MQCFANTLPSKWFRLANVPMFTPLNFPTYDNSTILALCMDSWLVPYSQMTWHVTCHGIPVMVLTATTKVYNWYGCYGNWYALYLPHICYQDYPSLGQITYVLNEQRIVPIFALINSARLPYNTVLHYEVIPLQWNMCWLYDLTVGLKTATTSKQLSC